MYSDVFLSLILCLCSLRQSVVAEMEGRVVGGEYTSIQKFPHAVFLHIETGHAMFICGASVLNQALLLTAAHCFEIFNRKSSVRVFGGHHDINQVTLVRNAKRVYKHRHYSRRSVANDIALVKLKAELPLGKYVKRVILRPNTPKQEGVLAGWGAIDADMSQFTFKLKAVKQIIRSRVACQKIGAKHPGMICAGSFKRTDSRAAKGDSGSGLITNDYQIVGLVSHVVTAFPALIVYTNVSFYLQWIEDKSLKISCPLSIT